MKTQSKFLTFSDGWKLIHDADNKGKDEKWYEVGIPKKKAVDATVPGYVHMFIPDCRGIAWYELNFENTLSKTANDLYILKFAMAEWHKEVYLNGKYVGTHDGTEDPFEFDVTKFIKKGQNRLTVRVSKPYTEEVDGFKFGEIPHRNEMAVGLKPGQCYNAFGLSGEINLVVTPKLYIEDAYIFANTETGDIEVEYNIRNSFGKEIEGILSTECSVKRTGEYVNADTYKKVFAPGDTKVKRKVKIDDFLWWDIDDPNLYNVNMSVATESTCHKTYKHCGFRTFEVGEDDGFFYLNGRRIYLKCSHTGNCMPESFHHISRKKELLRKDFSMAKAVGFNAVRFISGVALPEQLDYCDELGLMVYEEPVAGWILFDSKNAKSIYQHDLLSMIKRDRSHPCITIFGFLNETTTRQPYGKVYYYARNSLKVARKLDPTRLFIYSSGRFDAKAVSGDEYDPWCGSFANPGKTDWECLWNEDTDIPHYYEQERTKKGLEQTWKAAGDIHDYPNWPFRKEREQLLRNLGHYTKRPVFVSEIGVGSLLNGLWLERKFEEMDADKNAPDVKTVKKMNEDFLAGLKKFGFDEEFAYPIDILRQSEVNNNRIRSALFSILRSNPYGNGTSITGLLDHSICGEGLFTFMREYKPGMADTLQNGFAPTRWCLFMNNTHAYRNRPFEIEAVLAQESSLKPGKYPVSIKIVASDRSVVYSEDITLKLTAKDLKLMSVPVIKKKITLDVPTGEYYFRAELLSGGAATDGSLKFYVTDPDEIKATSIKTVVGVALPDAVLKLLSDKGVKVVDLSEAKAKSVILVGDMKEEEKEENWKKINKLIDKGARAFIACRYAFMKENDFNYYLPFADEDKPRNTIYFKRTRIYDWLYHKEYLLKRNHPYFEGLPTGMMDGDYYNYIISANAFIYDYCKKLPDEVPAMATSLGLAWGMEDRESMKADGVEIGTYNIGKGAMTICSFDLLENVAETPAADRMLMNILNTEADRLKK